MNIEDNYHTIALTIEGIRRGSREEEEKETRREVEKDWFQKVTVIGIVNVAVARG